MIITKHEFVPYFLAYAKKELEKHLPEEGFESEMFEKSSEVLSNGIGHVKQALKWPGD